MADGGCSVWTNAINTYRRLVSTLGGPRLVDGSATVYSADSCGDREVEVDA
jgi:hypothetical protein